MRNGDGDSDIEGIETTHNWRNCLTKLSAKSRAASSFFVLVEYDGGNSSRGSLWWQSRQGDREWILASVSSR